MSSPSMTLIERDDGPNLRRVLAHEAGDLGEITNLIDARVGQQDQVARARQNGRCEFQRPGSASNTRRTGFRNNRRKGRSNHAPFLSAVRGIELSNGHCPDDPKPYSFHLRVTRSLVFWSISNSFGHVRTRPSAGSFTVASKPILLPAPRSGLAWSRMSTGPRTISVSRCGSQLAKRWKSTSCSS